MSKKQPTAKVLVKLGYGASFVIDAEDFLAFSDIMSRAEKLDYDMVDIPEDYDGDGARRARVDKIVPLDDVHINVMPAGAYEVAKLAGEARKK